MTHDITRFSRRSLLKMGSGLALTTLAAPSIVRAQDRTITVSNGGGALEAAFRPAYFDTFEAKTGVRVISAPYMDGARLKAMVDAKSVNVDVTDLDAAEAGPAGKMGLLEEIDYNIVKADDLQDGSANKYWTNIYIAAYVIGWNTQAASKLKIPENWAEFFNPEQQGLRSLWRSANQTLEVAAMGAGQDPANLYPLDLDGAFSALDGIRDNISWFDSGAQGAQLISDNEVDFGAIFNGRIQPLKAAGAPVDFRFDNALFTFGNLSVPKHAPNPELSMQFISHCLEAKNQSIFANNIAYGPTNQLAFAELTPERLIDLPNSPQNFSKGRMVDIDYWIDNGAGVFDRFNNWLVQ